MMSYKKNIVLFGNGMLGRYVKEYLSKFNHYTLLHITRKEYDILKNTKDDLVKIFESIKTDNYVIINTIGLIPHKGIVDSIDYYMINSLFPKVLDEINQLYGGKLIHITTDCVFDGKSNGNYTEDSIKTETNDYGNSKAKGEDLYNATIIRTSIIGEQLYTTNFNYSLLEWVRSNKKKTIQGYTTHLWNGMTCLQLSEIIHCIIDDNLYWNGVRHLFSEHINKFELISIINKIYNLNIDVIPISHLPNINKTLTTKYNDIQTRIIFNLIQDIETQIKKQKEFVL